MAMLAFQKVMGESGGGNGADALAKLTAFMQQMQRGGDENAS
jgi:hypothetical protein